MTRWARTRKWSKRIALVVIALLVIFRISLSFIMPAVINHVASYYGLACAYERIELNVLGTDVGLWRLKLSPAEGGAALATADYVRADVGTFSLFMGRLYVWRAEADGVRLTAERTADGSIPILNRALAALPSRAARAAGPATIDLSAPLRVDALRLTNMTLTFHDASAQPPVESDVKLNLSLSDLNSPSRPTQFAIQVLADPLLDYLSIEGQGRASADSIKADVAVLMRGLHMKPAAAYLKALGVEPRADQVSLVLKAHTEIKVIDNGPATQPGGPQPSPAIAGEVALEDISLVADGRQSLGVDKLHLSASRLIEDTANFAKLTIEGVHVEAERSPAGLLRIAGVEIQPLTAPAGTQPASSVGRPASIIDRFRWRLGELDLRDLTAVFHDQVVTPEARLSLIIQSLAIKNLGGREGAADSAVELTGECKAPGLAGDIRIDGKLRPFSTPIGLHADLTATGVRPDALKPYLDRLSIDSLIHSGTLRLSLDSDWTPGDRGAVTANLAIRQVELADGEPLLRLDAVDVRGLSVEPAAGKVGATSIDIAGTSLGVKREADGGVRAIGFRLRPPVEQTNTNKIDELIAFLSLPLRAPKISLGRFTWKGLDLACEDQIVRPTIAAHITDGGTELTNLEFDPQAEVLPETPAVIHAWLAAPGTLGKVDAQAKLRASGSLVSASVSVTADDLRGPVLAPYLAPLGVEPTLQSNSAALEAQLDAKRRGDGWVVDMSVDRLRIAESGKEIASLGSLKVRGLALDLTKLRLESLDVTGPRLDVTRNADGTLSFAGLHMLPMKTSVSSTQPSDLLTQALSVDATIDSLHVASADIGWNDRAVSPAVDTRIGADVDLKNLALAPGKATAGLNASIKLTGIAESIKAAGTLALADRTAKVHAEVQGDGVTAGKIQAYLPSDLAVAWRSAHFGATVDAEGSANAKGGQAGKLTLANLDLRDTSDPHPLFHIDRAAVDIARFDLAGNVIAINDVAVAGVSSQLERSADGLLWLAGLAIRPSAEADLAAPTTQPGKPEEDLAHLLASRRATAPLITIDKFDLQAPNLMVRDRVRPSAAPLALKNVHVWSTRKWEWLGQDPSNRPPMLMQLSAEASPAARQVQVKLWAMPFAQGPRGGLDLDVSGIDGRGVLAILPELRGQVDGDQLTDGHFFARLYAHGTIDRPRPWSIDLARGGVFEFALADMEFRDHPGGPVLAGVKNVWAERVKVSRGWKTIRIGALDVNQVATQCYLDATGLHALGLMIPLPADFPLTGAAPATKPAAPTEPARAAPPSGAAAAAAGSERSFVLVEHLILSGFDGRLEDRTATPALVVPINGVELEARNISNSPLTQTEPLRFNLIVNAGKVSVPKHEHKMGLLGALSDTGKIITGHEPAVTEPRLVEQDLFSQIAAIGQIRFQPKPSGWVRLSVNGLDLRALHSEAAKYKVAVDSGVVDVTSDVRIRDDGDLDTHTRLSVTDLELAEPEHGLIARHLALPAPLDLVIKAIEGSDGSITLPVDLVVHQEHASYEQIKAAAEGGLGSVIATAIAASPLKIVGGVGSIIGLGGAKQPPAKEKPVELVFAPGYADLEGSDARALADLVARMKNDSTLQVTLKGELSSADVDIAGQRANPTKEDCDHLALELGQRVIDLSHQRVSIAGQAKAELGSMASAQAQATLARLKQVDRELAEARESLDGVYDLLRPGADRQAMRRTRAAALTIVQARLDLVRAALYDAGIADIARRVHMVAPRFDPNDKLPGRVVVTIVSLKHP